MRPEWEFYANRPDSHVSRRRKLQSMDLWVGDDGLDGVGSGVCWRAAGICQCWTNAGGLRGLGSIDHPLSSCTTFNCFHKSTKSLGSNHRLPTPDRGQCCKGTKKKHLETCSSDRMEDQAGRRGQGPELVLIKISISRIIRPLRSCALDLPAA